MIKPLSLYGVNNTTSDIIKANLIATMERGYKSFSCGTGNLGTVSLVGAGPSLAWTYRDIVGDVMACNSAHDYLIAKGVVPKYAMVWDANPIMEKVITPDPRVRYFLASRCHPSLFEKFNGFDVTVWHALGDECLPEVLNGAQKVGEPMVAGGSSSVTRATHLAGAMGYMGEQHLFGIDSSYADEETHVSGSVIDQQKMRIRVCGKWFTVAPWMAMQASDFKTLCPILQRQGIKIIVHGTGLIPYLATFFGCLTPDMHVGLFERLRRNVHAAVLFYLDLRGSPQLLGGSYARV